MKQDMILAGVGGQGVLTLAGILTQTALDVGLHIRQSEVHGMAQRGGPVNCHLRLSPDKVHSPLIPLRGADLILAVEPMEALRYLPWLKDEGWIVANEEPVQNVPDYPDVAAVLDRIRAHPRHVLLDARAVANKCGSPRSANLVMLGAAAPALMLAPEAIENAIKTRFESKGEAVVSSVLEAFRQGKAAAEDAM